MARQNGRQGKSLNSAYCRVNLPASMLACGSELRFRRRIIIFAFDLGSASSASVCEDVSLQAGFGGRRMRTDSSSTEAASIRPDSAIVSSHYMKGVLDNHHRFWQSASI